MNVLQPNMCSSALPGGLQIWILVMVTSLTRGEVIAPSNLNAIAGLPFSLGCNVTMETGHTVKQVRWLNQHKQVLLAYKPGQPVTISSQRDDVTLTASRNDVSVITIKRAGPKDEGCYQCIFDIYPSGGQEGKTCLNIIGEVGSEGNKTAVSGKQATLSCWYGLQERVHQVLWRKTAEQGDTTSVASYAKRGQPTVERPFLGRVTLSPSLGDTQLTIRPVKTEDEGCYSCEFHTYPEGTRRATACLSVYVLPKPEVTYVMSSSFIEANCTARSRPPAELVWNVEGDNRTLGPPVSSSYEQGDGTTWVISTLLLQSGLLNDLSVKCLVHHRGLETPMSVSLNTNVGPALAVLISVSCVAALLLLCLCVCLCKCFLCRDD
ncbi:OX-2 membrane glycoprotein-like isoform X2 [Osmerus mordax]|uniref:OX-2 membrane glycoprotein-like isoform X2 n=1 Tax=Osmerus mordax TaxID=8014 RepID=UPI003510531F